MIAAALPATPRHLPARRAVAAVAFAIAVAMFATQPAAAAPQQYRIDPDHMAIAFLVSHMGFAKTVGQFTQAEGTFVFDEQAPAVSGIDVRIKATSVDTHQQARDEHLRKEEFLWVEKYPEITFRGTAAEQTGARTGTITGDLTLRGVTRPVVLDVIWNRSGEYPIGDKHWAAGFSARTLIKRSDFGMTYALGMVGDEVEIVLEFEAIRQPS